MTHSSPRPHGPADRRKEERFQTSDEHCLHSRTSLSPTDPEQSWDGIIVDISPSGMRLLTDGEFDPGQAIWIELLSTHSHGVFAAHIRRVEPWTGGKQILGCSLCDPIPEDVLEELARNKIINRRRDGRFSISRPCTISWPLSVGEIDAEIRDYSAGGMKLLSADRIPDATRMRIRFDTEGESFTIEARPTWRRHTEQGWITGFAFQDAESSSRINEALDRHRENSYSKQLQHAASMARRVMTFAGFLTLFGYTVVGAF